MTRLLLLPLLAIGATGAAAQQPPPDPLHPSDAVAYARDHSPEYRQLLNDVEVARARTRAAWGAFLPSLSLSAGTGGATSTVVTGEDDAGQPIRLAQPLDFTSSSSSQSIGLGMTLFDGGASFQELAAERAAADATRARIDEGAIRLDARVLALYWQAVRSARAIEVEQSLLDAAHARLSAIERMFAIAAAGPEDVLGAQVDVATAELALERARGDAHRTRLALLEAMGAPLDAEPALAGEPPAPTDPALLDADALAARALAAHPALLAAEAGAEAAEQSLDAARARYWPRIDAGASFSRGMSLSSSEALFEPDPQNRSLGFDFSVSLPIFQGFRTRLATEQASAALDDARADVRAARLAVEGRVRTALSELHDAWRTLEVMERVARLSADRLAMAQERYRIGALRFAELQAVVERAEQAEREALDARFAYAIARVALEEAVGGAL